MGRWFAFVLLLVTCAGASAQDQEPVPEHLTTLRVFANLIQMPTMVLDRWGDPVRERAGQKFLVSMDGGKPFPATHVRMEGEDPITLSILVDASGSQRDLLYELPNALSKLAPLGFNPRDHVTIYTMDCKILRTLTDQPATAEALKKATADGINAVGLHNGKADPQCAETKQLWDTIAYMIAQMKTLPGRRVLLAITDGKDKASKRDWKELREEAHRAGVAIFAISRSRDGGGGSQRFGMPYDLPVTSALDALCQGSGGRIVTAEPASLGSRLRDFVKTLRNRYIVQFPRSKTMEAGSHNVDITVAGQNYIVRPAGMSVPIAGPEEFAPQPLAVEEPDAATPPEQTPPPDPH